LDGVPTEAEAEEAPVNLDDTNPIPPRQIATIALSMAGAPMTLAGLVQRLGCGRSAGLAVIADMLRDGVVKPTAVGDRRDLIQLTNAPAMKPEARGRKCAPKTKREVFTGRLKRADGETRKQIVDLLRTQCLFVHTLADLTGVAHSTMRDHLRELREEGVVRVCSYGPIPGSSHKRPIYELTKRKN